MTQTVSQALAKRGGQAPAARQEGQRPDKLIERYMGDFAAVLPGFLRPETFVRIAQGVLRRDPKIARAAEANPGSLLAALLDAARLGHEPGTDAYYLVPYGTEIQGIESYRGVIQRMYRSGRVRRVKAEIVRERDHFEYSPADDVPAHRVDWFAPRGEIVGAYAYAELADGSVSRVVIVDRDYIERVKRQSRGSDKPDSPWVRWEEAMILKTVVHRLEPWVPTSVDDLRAAHVAPDAPAVSTPHHPRPLPVEQPIEGEVVPDSDVTGAGEPELPADWPAPAQPGSTGIHP